MTSVSVLMPAYQEEAFLARCLDSLVAGDFDFKATGSEVLVIDGMSTDRTREIARDYAARHSFIRLVDNPETLTVKALNQGLGMARGEILLWLNVHCEYPPEFISECVRNLQETGAASVGAAYRTAPARDTPTAKAICRVLNSRLGVGVSYRTISAAEPVEVDTVPGGTWRRELFDEMGKFDEDFIRAQDFEFNTRLRAAGKKILLLPWLEVKYFPRESLGKFWRMAYQYGYWKVRINRKHRLLATRRQLFPPVAVLGNMAAAMGAFFSPLALAVFLAGNGLYLAATALTSLVGAVAERDGRVWLPMMAAFAIAHYGYGFGYLRGVLDFYVRNVSTMPRHLTTVTR